MRVIAVRCADGKTRDDGADNPRRKHETFSRYRMHTSHKGVLF